MVASASGNHVGGARSDRRGTGEGARGCSLGVSAASARRTVRCAPLCTEDRDFVAAPGRYRLCFRGRKFPAPGEEFVLLAIPLDVLILQEAQQRLSHRDATCFHVISSTQRREPVRPRPRFAAIDSNAFSPANFRGQFRPPLPPWRQRIFIAGVQNISPHQRAADIRSRGHPAEPSWRRNGEGSPADSRPVT